MRISDWSSDVCSSDLRPIPMLRHAAIGSAAPRDQAYGQYPASQCAHAGRNFGIAASAVRGVVTPAPGTWLAPVPDIRRRQRSDGADPVRGLTPPKIGRAHV